MRTLVISDLHLGSRLEHDVLRRPAALTALVQALEGVDRLVLLGDVVELFEGRPRVAMGLARPVLQAMGRAMGRDREIVVVLGNHDHALVRPWLRARARAGKPVGVATRVAMSSGRPLAELVGWLKPARVRVHYPGVWLGPRTWATHGHYLDRHLVSPDRWGSGLLGRVPEARATPDDYERASGPSVAGMSGLLAITLPRALGEPLDRAAGLARRAGVVMFPLAAALLGEGTLAPLSAGVLGFQFRRAGLPAMGNVAERLRIRADHVLFGHLHRGGPRAGDRPEDWVPIGRRALHNTGSWVYEPLLLAGASPPHAYWPGGAVLIDGDAPPKTLGLLDDIPERELRP